ncbi:hypothetical protein L873DRAFT_509161 [Choiromyces venosus 120613-1]|uniref:Uncharacterized protein n=1 Tax=Choiromyces venosus 120613-1 TaxID=1336337 RepID=A0A3N4IVP0_9PEZI|nr:hypothetical protein L873DRAFT_509161 [Choiromyces venosus 120613-1]
MLHVFITPSFACLLIINCRTNRNYGEDHSDLSGDILTELALQEGGDTPSQTLSLCESLSHNPTLATRSVPIDGGAGLASTERCGRADATVGVVKQSASGAGTSALVPLPERKRKFIKTSASSEIDEDMLVTRFPH